MTNEKVGKNNHTVKWALQNLTTTSQTIRECVCSQQWRNGEYYDPRAKTGSESQAGSYKGRQSGFGPHRTLGSRNAGCTLCHYLAAHPVSARTVRQRLQQRGLLVRWPLLRLSWCTEL
ncbi:hypothetical protein TNCV_1106301 [Trichonephila clavipes]|nr:hypothetical protein TNCV_1106301 [Trichonephila clavipes]